MNSHHILVAEDDKNIRIGLVDTLESEGYKVSSAVNGVEAVELFGKGGFDLIVLDIMMPGKSGYDVCREIRAKDSYIPIIMLTAKGEEIDKVVGLQLGADDYVTKPFGVHELLARIAAVLRRSRKDTAPAKQNDKRKMPENFVFGHAGIDTLKYKAARGKKIFDLSARELELMCLFKKHANEVLSRDKILNEIWGINYYGTTRTLDQHIAQLRKKVDINSTDQCIQTVHGVGYRYAEEKKNGG
jgi:DNA-binding response OmpR family regulator